MLCEHRHYLYCFKQNLPESLTHTNTLVPENTNECEDDNCYPRLPTADKPTLQTRLAHYVKPFERGRKLTG